MKFTKGEWKLKTSYGEFEIICGEEVIAGSDRCSIREGLSEEIYDEGHANARLMTASPEMYALIEYLATERNPNLYTAMDSAMKIRDKLKVY